MSLAVDVFNFFRLYLTSISFFSSLVISLYDQLSDFRNFEDFLNEFDVILKIKILRSHS